MKITKQSYINYLNEIGIPKDDLKSNGGRIPDYIGYGDWLHKNDPIAFNVGFNEFVQETRNS